MKKVWFAGLVVVASTVAYAVSIDFTELEATRISDWKHETTEDGATSSSEIEFAGPGLAPLMKLLPEVKDQDRKGTPVIPGKRILSITNAGPKDVDPDKATAIYFECNSVKTSERVRCSLTIIKGQIPG